MKKPKVGAAIKVSTPRGTTVDGKFIREHVGAFGTWWEYKRIPQVGGATYRARPASVEVVG